MYMETTLKTLVNIQKESDKVVEKIEKLNGELNLQGGDFFLTTQLFRELTFNK